MNIIDSVSNSNSIKKIIITGTNNKYQMNKLKKEPKLIKTRIKINKLNIPQQYFNFNQQLTMLQHINNNINNDNNNDINNDNNNNNNNNDNNDNNNDNFINNDIINEIIIQEIKNKLHGYKTQDKLKNKYNTNEFININQIIQSLVECNLNCIYCNNNMFILYNNVREPSQWSVDRIDNSLGHINNNYVLACLSCNIKRKAQSKDKFLFASNIKTIIKMENTNL
jgi:hypothetical protein